MQRSGLSRKVARYRIAGPPRYESRVEYGGGIKYAGRIGLRRGLAIKVSQ